MIRLGVGVRIGRSAVEFAAGRLPQIMATSLSPITTLSATGDPVATLSVANPAAGETYTWSLTDNAGGAVAINSSTGAVTVADASGVGLQTTFTARATGSPSTDTFDRVITTPVADFFDLVDADGFAIVDANDFNLVGA